MKRRTELLVGLGVFLAIAAASCVLGGLLLAVARGVGVAAANVDPATMLHLMGAGVLWLVAYALGYGLGWTQARDGS